ncbi:MAG TPA: HlyD family secretion protein [Bryobacteraceae bacterium]|nr:HlyD family secretion protein [Bryobacteraceae bacterium]
MPDYRSTYASEQELEELREEVRRLREEQQHSKKEPEETKKEEKEEPEQQKEKEEEKKPHPLRKFIIIGAVIVVAIIGVIWWLHSRQFEDTDDAQVDGHTSGIAARVAGNVVAVYVDENQFVKAGEVLVDLDPRDYKVAVEQARSQWMQAQAQTEAEQPNVPVTQTTNETTIANASTDIVSAQAGVAAAERDYQAALARIRESEANNAKAQSDVERYRPLAEKDEIPKEQFDQVVATAKAMAATVAANQATAASALRQVDQKKAQLTEAQQRAEEARKNAPQQVAIRRANVLSRRSSAEAAHAQLDQALLNLQYCKIVSPVNGIVSKRVAEVGEHLTPGQQVMLVTQLDDLWVTANFRETQLRKMHPGQSARIHVDALDGDFDGYLESMPAASGAITSLLPPENATGNYVKVVQRLPVRIRFKKGQTGLDRLRPGMSVEPKITVQ